MQQSIIIHTEDLLTLINNLGPYAMVIFTNNLSEINFDLSVFLKSLVNDNPAEIIDLKEVNRTHDNRLFKQSVFRNLRRLAVYVILPSKESEISATLDEIVKISPASARPRTLLYLPTNSTIIKIQKILKKAWFLKFLHFTVVTTDTEDSEEIDTCIMYNPFSDNYVIRDLKRVDELFPDKLINVYGYSLKTRAYDSPPDLTIRIEDGKIVKVGGTRFIRIKSIVKKFNFTLHVMEDPYDIAETFQKIIKDLETNQINVSPAAMLFTPSIRNKSIVYKNPWNLDKMVVVVPIRKFQRINAFLETFHILLIFCLILIIFYLFVFLMKPFLGYWNIFYIFGILIGTPTVQPQKNANKIIYLTIAILSVVFSNSYFSVLADVKLLFTEHELNTFEDINRLKIPIYYPSQYSDLYKNTEEEKIYSLKEIDDVPECINIMVKTNNAACITTMPEANYYSKSIFNHKYQPFMRITELSFKYEPDTYIYEKASPFAEKFDKTIRQVFESSIVVHKSKAITKVRVVNSKHSNWIEKSLLKQIIYVVLCFGYTLASAIFAWEHLHFFSVNKI